MQPLQQQIFFQQFLVHPRSKICIGRYKCFLPQQRSTGSRVYEVLHIKYTAQEIIDEYNLIIIVDNHGFVYVKIVKGM